MASPIKTCNMSSEGTIDFLKSPDHKNRLNTTLRIDDLSNM